jgi:hypothetical protein
MTGGVVKASGIRRVRSDRELDRRIAALALPALGSIAAEFRDRQSLTGALPSKG